MLYKTHIMKKETIDYRNEFNRQMYDRIGIMIPKGQKEEWKAEADRRNMSLAQFIQTAVAQYINCTEANEMCNFDEQNEK